MVNTFKHKTTQAKFRNEVIKLKLRICDIMGLFLNEKVLAFFFLHALTSLQ